LKGILLFFSPGRLLLVLCLTLSGYLLMTASGSFADAFRLAGREDAARREVEELRAEEARLTEIRDALRSDEYVEYIARSVFGLIKPGETLIIVNAPPSETDPEDSGDRWWEAIFGR
jgi:cell division protein FtsB